MMNYSMRVYVVLLSCMVSNMYATTTLVDVMDEGLGYQIKKFLMDEGREATVLIGADQKVWHDDSDLIQLSCCSHYFLKDEENPNRIICVNFLLCNPSMDGHISVDRFEEGIARRFGKAQKIIIYNKYSRTIDSQYFQKLRPYMSQITHMKIVYVDLVSIMHHIDLTSARNVVCLNIHCTFVEATKETEAKAVESFVDYIGQQSEKLQIIFIAGLSFELQNRLREKLPVMEFPKLYALILKKGFGESDISLDLIFAFVAQTEKLKYIHYYNTATAPVALLAKNKLFMYDFVKSFVTQYPDKVKKLSQLRAFYVGSVLIGSFLMRVIICKEAKQSEHFISMIENIPNYNFFRIEIDPRDIPGWSEFEHDGCKSLDVAIDLIDRPYEENSCNELVEACTSPFSCDATEISYIYFGESQLSYTF